MLVFFCLSQPIIVLRKESGNELRHSTIFQFIKQFWFNASISSHEARGFDTTIMARISTVRNFFTFIGPKSDHCIDLSLSYSLTPLVEVCSNWIYQMCYMDFYKLLFIKFDIYIWISVYRSCYMDWSKLIHGFLYVVTWICHNWCVDFSKLLHEFVQWIRQSCSIHFYRTRVRSLGMLVTN